MHTSHTCYSILSVKKHLRPSLKEYCLGVATCNSFCRPQVLTQSNRWHLEVTTCKTESRRGVAVQHLENQAHLQVQAIPTTHFVMKSNDPVKDWLCALQLGRNVALICFIDVSPQLLWAQAMVYYSKRLSAGVT